MINIITSLYLAFSFLVYLKEVFALTPQIPRLPPALQKVLRQAYTRPSLEFPTSFTQGIKPKAIHSHNDYLQPLPFYSALSVGAISVEADVWLLNDTLYVGHDLVSLSSTRTLESLYINPILETLKYQNPIHSNFSHRPIPISHNGVYDYNHYQTLYLYIDVKTDGETTWPTVIKALEPLRSRGYLTSTDGQKLKISAITVIGTGATPLKLVEQVIPRDYFYDVPIANLSNPKTTNLVSITSSVSFLPNFGPLTDVGLNQTQLQLLRAQLKSAHEKGIKLRYWGQPEWPASTRNNIWRQFMTEGVDLLCVDDLETAAGYGDFW